jgi:hypothetical protein
VIIRPDANMILRPYSTAPDTLQQLRSIDQTPRTTPVQPDTLEGSGAMRPGISRADSTCHCSANCGRRGLAGALTTLPTQLMQSSKPRHPLCKRSSPLARGIPTPSTPRCTRIDTAATNGHTSLHNRPWATMDVTSAGSRRMTVVASSG